MIDISIPRIRRMGRMPNDMVVGIHIDRYPCEDIEIYASLDTEMPGLVIAPRHPLFVALLRILPTPKSRTCSVLILVLR